MRRRGSAGRATSRAARLVAAMAALMPAALAAVQVGEPPDGTAIAPASPKDQGAPSVAIDVTPRDLLDAVPGRLDLFPAHRRIDDEIIVTGGGETSRKGAAAWIGELLAPLLEQDACRALSSRLGIQGSVSATAALARAFPASRPIASGPEAARLLVPDTMPPVSASDLEFFRASGLFPVEVALTGEWARMAAARHAGPVPRDPLLRAARAARLEGVARLAGLMVTVGGSNLDPADLGTSLLALDRDLAGWPRDELTRAVSSAFGDPVSRALVKMYVEDGVRWALMHYLRGGPEALAEALERPGIGPEGLLRPGARRPAPRGRPPGCRVGPRGAAALLLGDDDPVWVADLVEDSFAPGANGSVLGWLGFESAASAARAADDLVRHGLRAEARDAVVVVSLDPA